MRGTIYTSFVFAKQPKRIRQARGPACNCHFCARCCKTCPHEASALVGQSSGAVTHAYDASLELYVMP